MRNCSILSAATRCQIQVRDAGPPAPGKYIPQCTEAGEFEQIQCHGSIGQCWCADKDGVEIEGTRVGEGEPVCTGKNSGDITLRPDLTLTSHL